MKTLWTVLRLLYKVGVSLLGLSFLVIFTIAWLHTFSPENTNDESIIEFLLFGTLFSSIAFVIVKRIIRFFMKKPTL